VHWKAKTMREQLEQLGIEYRDEDQYATSCPKCSATRVKQGTKSLQVYKADDTVSFKCFHKGQCEWDKMTKIKVEVDKADSNVSEVRYVPFPRDYKPILPTGSIAYTYKNRDGDVIFYIVRTPDKKFFPIAWGADGNEYCKAPKVKALYRSEFLSTDGRPVIIVEGEKTADAAALIFQKADVVTWRGGANNTSSGDWDLLAGRTVILWPDNDEAGRLAMLDVQQLIVTDSCYMVNVETLPPKADLADNIPLETIKELWQNKTLLSKPLLQGTMKSDDLLSMYESRDEGYPFGYASMDKVLRLPERGLCVINGRTNHGKSLFMINVAANLLRQTDAVVIYLSYELTVAETNLRLIKAMHGVCYNPVTYEDDKIYKENIRNGQIPAIDEIKGYIEDKRFMLTDKPISIPEIKDTFKALSTKGKRAVLFVDYIQLIPNLRENEMRYLEIKKIVETLRQLALEYGHVIVGGSQLTEGETPRQDQSREGKDIMFTAALVLKLWNKISARAQGAVKRTKVKDPETGKWEDEEKDYYHDTKGDIIIDVLKTRQGQSGKCFGFNMINGNRLVEFQLPNTEF
jgi:KaiC/GvpD/RAD55 family RecA-like ATPase